MNFINEDLKREVDSYFQCDWNDYYQKDHKVKALRDEMEKLVDDYIKAKEIAKLNPSYAGSVVGIRSVLQSKKLDLIHAVEEAKKRERDIVEAQRKANTEYTQITTAQKAYRLSILSISVAAAIGIGSLIVQVYLNNENRKISDKQIQEKVDKAIANTKLPKLKTHQPAPNSTKNTIQ
jgi:hypothetical protein